MASLTFMQLWGPYEKLNFSRQAPMEQGRAGTFHIRQWVDFGVQSLDPVWTWMDLWTGCHIWVCLDFGPFSLLGASWTLNQEQASSQWTNSASTNLVNRLNTEQ